MALLPYLRLLRAGTLFSPGCDVVAGASVLAFATQQLSPWGPDLVRAIGASVALYASGMVANDLADVAEDRVQRPERPIPSGAVSPRNATVLLVVLLSLSLTLSPCRLWHGGMAVLVLGYDFVWKARPLLAALTMGGLRAANLGTAVGLALATSGPVATSPVPTELVTACVCYGIYVFAVTILGQYEDTPSVPPRAVTGIQTAPPLCAFGGVLAVQGSLWPAPAVALLPALWFSRQNHLRTTWDQSAIRQSMGYLLLGTMLYTALLALAARRPVEAIGIAACIPLARFVGTRLRAANLT